MNDRATGRTQRNATYLKVGVVLQEVQETESPSYAPHKLPLVPYTCSGVTCGGGASERTRWKRWPGQRNASRGRPPAPSPPQASLFASGR